MKGTNVWTPRHSLPWADAGWRQRQWVEEPSAPSLRTAPLQWPARRGTAPVYRGPAAATAYSLDSSQAHSLDSSQAHSLDSSQAQPLLPLHCWMGACPSLTCITHTAFLALPSPLLSSPPLSPSLAIATLPHVGAPALDDPYSSPTPALPHPHSMPQHVAAPALDDPYISSTPALPHLHSMPQHVAAPIQRLLTHGQDAAQGGLPPIRYLRTHGSTRAGTQRVSAPVGQVHSVRCTARQCASWSGTQRQEPRVSVRQSTGRYTAGQCASREGATQGGLTCGLCYLRTRGSTVHTCRACQENCTNRLPSFMSCDVRGCGHVCMRCDHSCGVRVLIMREYTMRSFMRC